jgi:DNA-directed RNA polymerase specialized sigma24 family protein
MQRRNLKWRDPAETVQTDQLLTGHYSRLLQWASALTRGDSSKAEEIVQEFCLYITLTKPDLSHVANLDGYLYTSLRHIYLSSLSRASREAMHLVSIEEFDSFAFAVSAPSTGDSLQRQNDLRRICAFAVWRKESSKSASYFILHFFHGYARREIAELALLPMAAIYNKLKTARSEVRSYLGEPGKLRMVNSNHPPEPALSWSPVSSIELFNQLRASILAARATDCLPEEELLAHYRSSTPRPISCSLLAHMVSCERCLSAVDHHFRRPTLKDREPLDALGLSSEGSDNAPVPGNRETEARLQSLHQRWGRVFEHRPRTLSIAVNGQIVAFHDVRAEHNKLSARLEQSEKAQFVEVFSEQNVRLALLPVTQPPPEGPELQTLRVALSDARWLELNLTYDGLGLHSEVAYFDPALAIAAEEEDAEEPVFVTNSDARVKPYRFLGWIGSACAEWARTVGAIVSPPAMVWGLTLLILISTAGYFAYRHTYAPMDAAQILRESIRIENASLEGQTEHQVLQVEETSADGRVLQQGTVDVWKDGDGSRYMRRLYNMQNRMIAEKWRNQQGNSGARGEAAEGMNGLWDQDLSAQGFAALGDRPARVRSSDGGYELTRVGPTREHPQLLSATLTLDRNLQPIRQIMRVRAGGEVHEVRFEVADYERKPSGLVPDATFNPEDEQLPAPRRDQRSSTGGPHDLVGITNAQLAELQIGVLYQLHALHADTGVPIEVVRTADNRVRVSGTVSTDALKKEIDAQLKNMEAHERLDLRIVSSREIMVPSGSRASSTVEAYEVTQPGFVADIRIREYFQTKGLSGGRLDAAVALFSRDALQHAQRALQHAYALDRLGTSLSADELRTIRPIAQQEWTGMVKDHATGLETELRALHGQLAEILLAGVAPESAGEEGMSIDEPAQFAIRAGRLLEQVRGLNLEAGELFASSGKAMSDANLKASLQTVMDTIPLQQAEEIAAFAVRLSSQTSAAQTR